MTRVEQLNQVLQGLKSGAPELEACAVLSEDGLVLASALPPHLDDLPIARMAATLLSLGERAASELARGKLEQVLVRGEAGLAVVTRAGKGAVLLALAQRDAKLGLVFYDLDHAASEIRRIL